MKMEINRGKTKTKMSYNRHIKLQKEEKSKKNKKINIKIKKIIKNNGGSLWVSEKGRDNTEPKRNTPHSPQLKIYRSQNVYFI